MLETEGGSKLRREKTKAAEYNQADSPGEWITSYGALTIFQAFDLGSQCRWQPVHGPSLFYSRLAVGGGHYGERLTTPETVQAL